MSDAGHATDNRAAKPEFEIGDRVEINYGPGTVVDVKPNLVVVHADIGQAWFRRPEEVDHLGT